MDISNFERLKLKQLIASEIKGNIEIDFSVDFGHDYEHLEISILYGSEIVTTRSIPLSQLQEY